MNSLTTGWSPRERALLALCVVSLGISIAAYANLGGSAGAAPNFGSFGTSIDTGEIRNNTIRPRDVRRVNASDLGLYVRTGPLASVAAVPGREEASYGVCDPEDVAISGGLFGSTGNLDVAQSRPELIEIDPVGTGELGIGSAWQFVMRSDGQHAGTFRGLAICMNG